MRRTTITLPDDLAAAIKREALHRGVPVSQVVREALDERFRSLGRTRHPLAFTGIGRSGYTNTARNFDAALEAERARDRDR